MLVWAEGLGPQGMVMWEFNVVGIEVCVGGLR